MEFFLLLWIGGACYFLVGLVLPSFFKKDSRTLIKFYKLYSLLGSIYVCGSCIYSSGLPFLLAMTEAQRYPLVFCFMDYWADIGLFLRGVKCDLLDEDTIKFHHSLAIIGVAFELYYWIGGGMMMCLLMDTVEVVFTVMEDVIHAFLPGLFTRNLQRFWSRLCWVLWILFRLVWYCVVSVWSLATMVGYYFFFSPINTSSEGGEGEGGGGLKIGLFGLMTLCWVLYANWDHFTQFQFHYKRNTNHLHDVLPFFGIPLPSSSAPNYLKRPNNTTTTTTTSQQSQRASSETTSAGGIKAD